MGLVWAGQSSRCAVKPPWASVSSPINQRGSLTPQLFAERLRVPGPVPGTESHDALSSMPPLPDHTTAYLLTQSSPPPGSPP